MLDKLLTLTLDLNRLDARTKGKVTRVLKSAERELALRLSGDNLTEFNRARLNLLLKDSQAVLNDYYGKIDNELNKVLQPMSEIVAKDTVRALEDHLPANMEAHLPPENILKTIAKDTLVLGSPTSEWWDKQSKDVIFRYKGAVRQGVTLGETNQQIVRRVKDVMRIATRNARSLVQTSVSSISNESRRATFRQNSDVVKGQKWISALDGNVCEMCMARADKEWELNGTPIGHSVPFSIPPIHYNDRCIMTAITKTFAELGFPDIPEPRPGQRASVSGPVDANTTLDDFFKTKGKAWQEETMGKGRAELWRDGKINLENLINGEGRPLTIDELRRKYDK